MLNERLRRVTDLFVEGEELFFGFEPDNTPILMWVNKLNSFEVEEAVRDGNAKRGIRLAQLSQDDANEIVSLKASLASWTDERLAERRVEQMVEDIYLQVINDLDTSEEWRDKIETVRRGSALLDDEGAPEDDARREAIAEMQVSYLDALRRAQEAEQHSRLADVRMQPRAQVEADFLEEWRKRASVDVFMQERRLTEIYMALRDCRGTVKATGEDGKMLFDHTSCDHSRKMLTDRSEVRDLPEAVIGRIIDALDGITVPAREAGNSDAPESSSASSEQSRAAEEASTPSTQMDQPPAVLTT